MTRNELTAFLVTHGFVLDAWGNYRRAVETSKGTRLVRFKMQDRSARLERRALAEEYVVSAPGHKDELCQRFVWRNMVSDYYSNMRIDEQDRLCIGGRTLKL